MAYHGGFTEKHMNTTTYFDQKINEAVWAILDAKIIAYENNFPWDTEAIIQEVVQRINDINQEATRIIKQST